MEKSATDLEIPFSLSREHTSNFKYQDAFTMQAHLQYYWDVPNWCILDFQSLQIFLGIYIICVDLELYICTTFRRRLYGWIEAENKKSWQITLENCKFTWHPSRTTKARQKSKEDTERIEEGKCLLSCLMLEILKKYSKLLLLTKKSENIQLSLHY